MDLCLCQTRATYSPEIQYIAHIYFSSSFKYKNIRVDYNNINSELNKMALYNIMHDPERFITYNILIIKEHARCIDPAIAQPCP